MKEILRFLEEVDCLDPFQPDFREKECITLGPPHSLSTFYTINQGIPSGVSVWLGGGWHDAAEMRFFMSGRSQKVVQRRWCCSAPWTLVYHSQHLREPAERDHQRVGALVTPIGR